MEERFSCVNPLHVPLSQPPVANGLASEPRQLGNFTLTVGSPNCQDCVNNSGNSPFPWAWGLTTYLSQGVNYGGTHYPQDTADSRLILSPADDGSSFRSSGSPERMIRSSRRSMCGRPTSVAMRAPHPWGPVEMLKIRMLADPRGTASTIHLPQSAMCASRRRLES